MIKTEPLKSWTMCSNLIKFFHVCVSISVISLMSTKMKNQKKYKRFMKFYSIQTWSVSWIGNLKILWFMNWPFLNACLQCVWHICNLYQEYCILCDFIITSLEIVQKKIKKLIHFMHIFRPITNIRIQFSKLLNSTVLAQIFLQLSFLYFWNYYNNIFIVNSKYYPETCNFEKICAYKLSTVYHGCCTDR